MSQICWNIQSPQLLLRLDLKQLTSHVLLLLSLQPCYVVSSLIWPPQILRELSPGNQYSKLFIYVNQNKQETNESLCSTAMAILVIFLNENIELIVIGYKLIDFLEHVVFRQDKNFFTRRQVFILHIHATPPPPKPKRILVLLSEISSYCISLVNIQQ